MPGDATTDPATTDEHATGETTNPATTDEPTTLEPATASAKAPAPRSIARDVALVAVVFVAVFILLGGLLSLAAPSVGRGVTRASPASSVISAVDPTPIATAP